MAREHSTYDLTYDPADQLVKSVFKGLQGVPGYNREFGYDGVGNRLSDSHGNTLSEFVSNFLTRNGQSSFTADPDGLGQVAQEITGNKAKNYTYRGDGRISGFQSGNLSVSYFYDALSRLVARIINENGVQKVESFVHLDKQDRVLLGKAMDGSITTYIDGLRAVERLGEVKNGVGKGYITDHLGSVLNSPFGGLSKTIGLFGEIFTKPKLADDAGPIHYVYVGYSYDPYSETYMNGPRNMNPEVGRWNSQEPTGVDGPNYYWYAKNNSLINIDPTGRASGNYTDNMGSLPQSGTGAAAGTSGLEQSARGLGRLGGAAFGVCAAGAASPEITTFCLFNPIQCQEIGLAVAAGIGQGTSGTSLPPDPTQPWEPALIEKILETLSGN